MSESVDIPDKLFFRIGETAELVGVEPHVLRYWEGEFRMRPQRSASGQRMYRRKDIEKFLRIRNLLHEEGFTIAGARKALSDPGHAQRAAPSAATSDQVREATDRLTAIRKHIAELRERFSTAS